MNKQQGFTLIELVVVLVLLGILGAVATAKFQNLSAQAADAVESGVAGELASGSAINFAARTLTATAGTAITGTGGTPFDCATTAPALLQSGALPAGVTLTTTDGDCTGDSVVTCTVNRTGGTGTDATATILCIN